MQSNGGALYFDALLNDTRFRRQLTELSKHLDLVTNRAVEKTSEIDAAFNKLAATLAGVFTISAAQNFVSQLINVRGEFQQLEIAFTTMLRSKTEADKLMKDAVRLAAITPFGLQDVANGAKQLLAYGTAASDITNTISMLGNIASGVGAPLNDIVYLYGTLQTQGRAFSKDIQQFTGRGIPIIKELAAQFKVTEKEVMGLVEAGKVGFPEVEKAFQSMTSSSGMFYNLMEEQSKSLTGQFSNLEDAWASMLNEIGKSSQEALSGGISAVAFLIENYEKVLETLGGIIATYGVYRAAIVANTLATSGMTAAELIHYGALVVVQRAQALLNLTMLANPYVAVATTLAALASIVAIYGQTVSLAEQYEKKHNEEQRKAAELAEERKTKYQELTNVLRDGNATEFQRNQAYEKLQAIYPALLANMTRDQFLRLSIADAQKKINQAEDGISVENFKASIDKKNKELDELLARLKFIDAQIQKNRGDSLSKSSWEKQKDETQALYFTVRAVNDELKKQEELAKLSLMSDSEKLKYYQSQRSEIQNHINLTNKLNGVAGNTKNTFLSWNLDLFQVQVNDITKKINDLQNKTSNSPISTLDDLDSKIKELRDSQGKVTENAAGRKEYAALESEIKALERRKEAITGKVSTIEKKRNEEAIAARKAISDAETEASLKRLDNNKREIAEARLKYQELRKLASKNNLGAGVQLRIDRIEKSALGDITFRQDTDLYKSQLERQKALYDEFEEYKNNHGLEKAKEKYKNELDLNSSFLQEAAKKFTAAYATNFALGGTPNSLERLNYFSGQLGIAQKSEEKKYNDLLAGLTTYEQKRKQIESKYKEERAVLESKQAYDQINILDKLTKEALGNLDDDNSQKLEAYKKLFLGVEELSDEAAKKVIDDAKLMLTNLLLSGKISDELFKQISNKINESQKSLVDRLPKELQQLGNEIKNIGQRIRDVNFGEWISSIGEVIGSIGEVKAQMESLRNLRKGDSLGTITGGMGIFSSFLNIGQSLAGLLERGSKARNEQAIYASELQIKQTEALTRALDRQLELINKVYGTEKLSKYAEALAEIANQTNKAKSQLSSLYSLTGDKTIDNIIQKINSGQGLQVWEESIANQLRNNASFKIPVNDLKELQKLLDEGRLDEKAAKLAQTILDLNKKAGDVAGATSEELTGSTFSSIADGILDAITSGAEDGAKNFEEIMRKAMINSLKSKELTTQLQQFYDDFAEANKNGGLDEAKIAALRAQYEKIITDGKAAATSLEKVTGVSLNDPFGNTSGLTGAIKRDLTEQTASELAGLYRAQYDLAKKDYDILVKKYGLDIDTNAIMKQQLSHLANIDRNTGETATNTARLEAMEKSLKAIENNTKAQSGRDLGIKIP